jgi:hypothetical protein
MASSYSLEDFMTQYSLTKTEAQRIFRITGPLKADIDAFMAVKSQRADASDWMLDPYKEVPNAKMRFR